MASHYHARDRTVLKNSRDGLQMENLHTKEAVSVSKKEKEMAFRSGSGEETSSQAKRDASARKKRRQGRFQQETVVGRRVWNQKHHVADNELGMQETSLQRETSLQCEIPLKREELL